MAPLPADEEQLYVLTPVLAKLIRDAQQMEQRAARAGGAVDEQPLLRLPAGVDAAALRPRITRLGRLALDRVDPVTGMPLTNACLVVEESPANAQVMQQQQAQLAAQHAAAGQSQQAAAAAAAAAALAHAAHARAAPTEDWFALPSQPYLRELVLALKPPAVSSSSHQHCRAAAAMGACCSHHRSKTACRRACACACQVAYLGQSSLLLMCAVLISHPLHCCGLQPPLPRPRPPPSLQPLQRSQSQSAAAQRMAQAPSLGVPLASARSAQVPGSFAPAGEAAGEAVAAVPAAGSAQPAQVPGIKEEPRQAALPPGEAPDSEAAARASRRQVRGK